MAIFDNIFVTRKFCFIISKTYGYSSKKKERLSSSMPFYMETPEYCNAVDKPNDPSYHIKFFKSLWMEK